MTEDQRAEALRLADALDADHDDAEDEWVTMDAAAALLRTLAAETQSETVSWIDNSGHPKHISHIQSATEHRLYGPLRPLYEGTKT